MDRVFDHRVVRLLAFVVLLAILWAGLKPEPFRQYVLYFDKYMHVLGFALLAVFFCMSFPRLSHLTAVYLLVGLGLVIEVAQDWFLPDRSFDLGDLLMDALGVVPVVFCLYLWRRNRRNELRPRAPAEPELPAKL